ncbi:CBS domain-containing protein [Bdellovibrio sp. HCB337]|uniref:CBS domain-containing protein n=1 Tax=Bdellovibrio sp. HCB337 TaxID=3394358 RepID=UPI0039A4EFC4
MLVREVMKENAEVINCERNIREAAEMMAKGNFGGIPVERNDKMIGMITDRDIVIRVVAAGKDPETTRVLDSMSEGISYCFDDEDVEEVARKMSSVQVRRLPVVNRNKKLVGIVSLVDIARKAKNEKLTHETMSQTAH